MASVTRNPAGLARAIMQQSPAHITPAVTGLGVSGDGLRFILLQTVHCTAAGSPADCSALAGPVPSVQLAGESGDVTTS